MKQIRNVLTHIMRRRRALAVVAAMVSVLAICSVATGHDEPTTTVYTAVERIEAGSIPTSDQVKRSEIPTAVVPEGAITSSEHLDEHMMAAPVPAGAILTDDSFVSLSSAKTGHVVIPLTVSTQILDIIRPGDHVSVFWSDPASGAMTVSKGIRVVTVPTTVSSGLFSSGGSADVILAEVPEEVVSHITQSADTGTVLVALE
ncbi:MAG: hypothetical protein LBV00_03695 [Propionibacteriaceae bacterium]|nr:hypothetical protein [Propionibacteriaceae bacterium]